MFFEEKIKKIKILTIFMVFCIQKTEKLYEIGIDFLSVSCKLFCCNANQKVRMDTEK